ncbi:MAG TPA: cytochrome c oxidase assembly protein [Anaerolineales bacterium]|nr:cytochrome c oxidase assembly protein [Anaerolineales bacterium]
MNGLRSVLQSGRVWVLVFVIAGLLAGATIFLAARSARFTAPEMVVQEYITRVYARDYRMVYELISATDKQYKTLEDYLRENSSFTGFALEASRKLTSYIEFGELQVDRQGDRATVIVHFIVPDGNAGAVSEILFADTTEFTETERNALLESLGIMLDGGEIPTLEGEQTFELVKENWGWRILENWAEAIRVHFSGEAMNGLPWEFEPLQEIVLAKPGEIVRAVYRAKNLSGQPVTAKARHTDQPHEYLNSMNIMQCFCLIQQTLQPGEEMEMASAFWVAPDVPPMVKDFYIHYEFYPIETFPDGGN